MVPAALRGGTASRPLPVGGATPRTRTRTVTLGADDPDGAVVRRSVLPGGLRVVTEAVPGVRSVSFGVWVGVGSRDESPSLAGASHYLEHLLFKGTARRNALEISSVIEAVGGEMNAFTTKEYTCFYARVLDRDLALAVDVVSDMVTASRVAATDVESERNVVLEEIAMHDDDPGDGVHDVFAGALFGGGPLGRPVLGSQESITAMSREAIAGYYRRRYRPPVMVIAVSGRLQHPAVLRLVRASFAAALDRTGAPQPAGPRSGPAPVAPRSAVAVLERPTEQANLVLGCTGLARHDERRFALEVLNVALGGGMSSRLFQEIRERRGLAYSVYSFASAFAETGMFGVSVGCAPRRAREVVDLCRSEIALAVTGGITAEELERGKGQLRGGLLLGLEDTGSRMSRLGKAELVHGEILGVDEVLARIDAVTLDDVRAVAAEVLTRPLVLGAVGPLGGIDLSGAVA
jgi:predicted Zn-dependent peptidase